MEISNLKVVILGQDPYPVPSIATGLAFGIEKGTTLPPSLNIIQTELAISYYNDITYYIKDVTLESWEKQGVLLLNASLSCTEFLPESEDALWLPESHSYLWRLSLMENLFKWMSDELNNIVFVFMGRKAQYYNKFIDHNKHAIINSYHPVADYRSGTQVFIGSKVFNNINTSLKQYGKEEIEW